MISSSSPGDPSPQPQNRWKNLAGLVGGIFLGGVFLLAAWGKSLTPGAFVEQIQLEGLDVLLPAATLALLSLALEAGLGLALVLGIRRIWVLAPTSFLVAFFVFLNARNYYLVSKGLRDPEAACGCFGKLIERTAAEAFWQDLFLLVIPLLVALWGRARQSQSLPRVRLSLAAVAAAVAVGLAWNNPDLHFAGAAAQIAAQAAEESFLQTSDYVVLVDDEQIARAQVYYSEGSAALLIVVPRLSFPVLLDPRAGAVKRLAPEGLHKKDDGRIELVPKARPQPLGKFEMKADGIVFSAAGRKVELKSGTW